MRVKLTKYFKDKCIENGLNVDEEIFDYDKIYDAEYDATGKDKLLYKEANLFVGIVGKDGKKYQINGDSYTTIEL